MSEEFDNKIKSAAAHHHPDYEEDAWKKMNKLFGKHLPEKKKRSKRLIILLILPLFLAGVAYYALQYPKGFGNTTVSTSDNIDPQNNNKTNSIPNQTNTSPTVEKEPATKKISASGPSSETKSLKNTIPVPDHSNPSTVSGKDPQGSLIVKNNKGLTEKNKLITPDDHPVLQKIADTKDLATHTQLYQKSLSQSGPTGSFVKNTPKEKEKKTGSGTIRSKQINNPATNNLEQDQDNLEKSESPVIRILQTAMKEKAEAIELTRTDIIPFHTIHQDMAIPVLDKQMNIARKKRFIANISLGLSAGPDISAVGINAGKTEIVRGAGLGLSLSKRVSLRTGFYTAQKVYTAAGSDYKGSPAFMNYYPNLKSVDANCKVYEIPLLLNYSFGQKRSHGWFLSTGLSSLIMKKETYNYYYKPNYSPDYIYYKKTFNNKNKHILSTLALSGGYQVQLNSSLSFVAEPYLRIPLTGIGEGKLHLNSAGMLFTFLVRPFK
ncbi:MAG: hypothetical protein GC171_12475 [Terrimonas sp.]|nr:hypothetical protein [Terrimonas sp.]